MLAPILVSVLFNPLSMPIASPDPISNEEKRAALDSALTSGTFSRADQLRSFLRFICEMELEGRAGEINEYEIAVKALGRTSNFSALEDSCVRVMAHNLRQKLEEFYSREGSDAAVRIQLTKGSYQPRFVRAEKRVFDSKADSTANSKAKRIPGDSQALPMALPVGRFRLSLISFLAGAMAAIILLVLFSAKPSPTTVDPVILEAWGPIAKPDANVLIAVGNPFYMIFHAYPVTLPVNLSAYPAPEETYAFYRKHRPLPKDAKLTLQKTDSAVSMGHVLGIVSATKLLTAAGASYQVLPEHAAPLPSFRGRNVLLIGNPEDSLAVSSSLENMPFTVAFDTPTHEFVIRDRRNNRVYLPGRDTAGRFRLVYGLITVFPTDGTADGSRRTVVFSGITSVGIHAAVEFMASPASLHTFLDHIEAEGYHSFPRSYQIVVRATTADTLLAHFDYEAHAIVDKPLSAKN